MSWQKINEKRKFLGRKCMLKRKIPLDKILLKVENCLVNKSNRVNHENDSSKFVRYVACIDAETLQNDSFKAIFF